MNEPTPFRKALHAALEKRQPRINPHDVLSDFNVMDLLQDMYYAGCNEGIDRMSQAMEEHRKKHGSC